MEPVPLRNIARGDGEKAGQSRLRGQQVVVRRIETARAFGVGQPISDRKQMAGAIVEKPEVHALGKSPTTLRKRDKIRRRMSPGGVAAYGDPLAERTRPRDRFWLRQGRRRHTTPHRERSFERLHPAGQ